jgi:hypothetical protein
LEKSVVAVGAAAALVTVDADEIVDVVVLMALEIGYEAVVGTTSQLLEPARART